MKKWRRIEMAQISDLPKDSDFARTGAALLAVAALPAYAATVTSSPSIALIAGGSSVVLAGAGGAYFNMLRNRSNEPDGIDILMIAVIYIGAGAFVIGAVSWLTSLLF